MAIPSLFTARERGHDIIAGLILVAALALSAGAALLTQRHMEREAELRFDASTRALQSRIEEEIHSYEEVLLGLRALFSARGDIGRREFGNYVTTLDLKRRYPGFQNLNYAAYVRLEDLDRLEAGMRRELGRPEVAIKPTRATPEHNVITFIEPLAPNAVYLGTNINANPASAEGMSRVRDSGVIVTSSRLIRMEGPERTVALAMRLAVYRNGMPTSTLEERRAAFAGSVGAGFRVRDLMKGALDYERLGHVRFQLYDRGLAAVPLPSKALTQDALIFDSAELAPADAVDMAADAPRLRNAIAFPVGSRLWEVQYTAPLSISGISRFTPALSLLAGILASTLLFLLYRSLAGSRRRAEDNFNHLAKHDALTGLPNREDFVARVAEAITRAERGGRYLAVLQLDLDRFKKVNDTLGHGAGDAALKACASRLRRALRDTDILARMSGDEFAVLVDPCPQPSAAAAVARKMLDAVDRPLIVQGQEIVLTASIGISVYHEDGRDIETLLKHADIALFRAKDEGRNAYQFYSAQMNPHGVERLRLEAALRRALERRELSLHYQPKMDLATSTLTGFEALLRWNHPELGMVSPAKFIPIAEETGLIEPIGAWVLQEACAQARRWADEGLAVGVAVNLSARQFRHQRLAREVRACLSATNLDARLLELELTESMVMQDAEQAAATLRELKAIGVTLSIDDFGTGYSSLAYLKRFAIDRVKIDRSFVKDIPGNRDDVAIVQAVIGLAHGLNMRVIAEGVETVEQRQHLRELACDEMQGYLVAKPLPVDEATRFLRTERAQDAPRSTLRIAS